MSSDRDRANDAEWADERNWHLGHTVYWSGRDSRLVVPKWQATSIGFTLNFGRRAALLSLAMVLVPPIIIWVVMALAT